jgi:hypothetical protein
MNKQRLTHIFFPQDVNEWLMIANGYDSDSDSFAIVVFLGVCFSGVRKVRRSQRSATKNGWKTFAGSDHPCCLGIRAIRLINNKLF